MREVNVYGWPGYSLSAKDLTMVMAPVIGGRIISLNYQGEELFFVDENCQGEVFDFSKTEQLRAAKRKMGFKVWGGDKTWVAPQKDWWEGMPPLELDAGSYRIEHFEGGVRMISPTCRETGMKIVREVRIDADATIYLSQEMTNESKSVVRKGIWNVTQLKRPFDVYIPGKQFNFRSYHEEDLTLPDCQLMVVEHNGWCQIPCKDNTLFKFGGMADTGAVLCLRYDKNQTLAFLKMFELEREADFAHRSSVEVFNACNHDYLEVEVHAPVVSMKPAAVCLHRHTWKVKKFAGIISPAEVFAELSV